MVYKPKWRKSGPKSGIFTFLMNTKSIIPIKYRAGLENKFSGKALPDNNILREFSRQDRDGESTARKVYFLNTGKMKTKYLQEKYKKLNYYLFGEPESPNRP